MDAMYEVCSTEMRHAIIEFARSGPNWVVNNVPCQSLCRCFVSSKADRQ